MEIKSFKDLNVKSPPPSIYKGEKIEIFEIIGQQITVNDYDIGPSKFSDGNGKCLNLQLTFNGVDRLLFSGSGVLMFLIEQIPKSELPFTTTIVKKGKRLEFT